MNSEERDSRPAHRWLQARALQPRGRADSIHEMGVRCECREMAQALLPEILLNSKEAFYVEIMWGTICCI